MILTRLISVLIFMAVFYSSAVSAQFSFSQPATGPSSVCEGSDVSLQCRIVLNDNPQNADWYRNGILVRTGSNFIPNHNQMFNSTTGLFADLVITDVTLEDDNTVYTCNSSIDSITSSVVLNVSEIPPVHNLMVADQCTTIRASWDITEGSCTNLSYDVTLLSSDGVILQGTTNDTVYNFIDVETLNGTFNVSVVPINGNARGANVTKMAVIGVLPSGLATVTNIRSVLTCVTSLIITWDEPNITCGVVNYEVSVSQNEGDAEFFNGTEVDNRMIHVSGLDNNLPVTVNVTIIIDRVGERNDNSSDLQLLMPEDVGFVCQDFPLRCNVMPSHFDTTANVTGFDGKITWQEPVTNSCTTLPIPGYYINITCINGPNRNYTYTSRFVDATEGDSMGMFTFYYSQLFEEMLLPNTRYVLTVVPTDMDDIETINVDVSVSASSSPDDGCNDLCLILIIVGVCVIAVWIWCMSSLYCHEKIMEEGFSDKEDDRCGCVLILFTCGIAVLIRNCCSTSSNCRKIFFLISSFGLGYVVWIICRKCCLERTRASSVQQEIAMDEKSTDLYDSPGTKPVAHQGKAAENQAVYSYARTGPINVIVPGSANS